MPIGLVVAGFRLAHAAIHARTRAPHGDFRPWDDIADWAREIARYLSEEPAGASDARRAHGAG